MNLLISKYADGRVLPPITQDHGIRKDYLDRYKISVQIARARAKSSYIMQFMIRLGKEAVVHA